METARVEVARNAAQAESVRHKAKPRADNAPAAEPFAQLLQHLTQTARHAAERRMEGADAVEADGATTSAAAADADAPAPAPNAADDAAAAATAVDDGAETVQAPTGTAGQAAVSVAAADEDAATGLPAPAQAKPQVHAALVEGVTAHRATVPAHAIVAIEEAAVATVDTAAELVATAEAAATEADIVEAAAIADAATAEQGEPAEVEPASLEAAMRASTRARPQTAPRAAPALAAENAPSVATATAAAESASPVDAPDTSVATGVQPGGASPVHEAGAATPHVQARADVIASRPTLETVGAHVVRSVRLGVSGEDTVLRLRLMPETLGEVRVEITAGGSRMALRLTAETAAVRQVLEDQAGQLRHSLAQQGFDVGELIVTDNGAREWHGGRDFEQHASASGEGSKNPGESAAGDGMGAAVPRHAAPHAGALNLFA